MSKPKPNTSFTRIIGIALFCFIAFPYTYQILIQYQSSRAMPDKIEGLEIMGEFKLVKHHVSRYVKSQGQWPNSLINAGYYGNESLLKFDLSKSWTLHATINDKVLNKTFEGRTVQFNMDPETGEWYCDSQVTDLPEQLSPTDCNGKLEQLIDRISPQTWYLLIALAAIVISVLLAIYKHPLLKKLRHNHFSLTQFNYKDLHKLKLLSRITGHQIPILQTNQLNHTDWLKLAKLYQSDHKQQIKALSRSLPVDSSKTESKNLFRFTLSNQFELNISELLVFISDDTQANQVINRINRLTDQLTPLLLWVNSHKANIVLRTQKSRINRPTIIPNQQEITQLLLHNTARNTLIELAAKHLPINTISPYQGKGGIIKSSHFFGRRAILDKLDQQFNSNFLLVGGRQLGKTSLLKALFRKLNHQSNNHCLYLSLSDERLLPRLAYHAKICEFSGLNDLTQQIKAKYPQKKIRLLIDEADLFIQADINNGYKLLSQIRQVAENSTCQFIFAGFWELYANAVLDYHSPLRNLAHSITIGPLEAQPAMQLIQQPMSILRQKFASQQVIQDIYQKTGGRANLINLVCEFLVEQLTDHQQIIDTALVEQAYQSTQVQDALQGWSNLTSDAKASALDRIIVYLIFLEHSIDLKIINQVLQQHSLNHNPEQLKQSLQRLRLAHIISKHKQSYQFAVPLFLQQHDAKEAEVLLQQEIQLLQS